MEVVEIDTSKVSRPALKRVAGYARVSVDRMPNAESLKIQSSFLRKYIGSNPGWVDCGVFLDLGFSGTRKERPGFLALIEKCEKGEVDLIITKSISRFCRNTIDLLSVTRHLKDLGVEVFFDENGISSLSAEGELIITLLAAQAQEESRYISENILWSIRKKFEAGIEIPSNLLGYRWDGKKYCIRSEEADLVRRIFAMYLSGLGPEGIANSLNREGLKGLHGAGFSGRAIEKILGQEKYTGNSLLQKSYTENHISHRYKVNHGEKDMFYVEDTHPPILDRETFEKVQKERERRRALGAVGSNWSLNTSIFTSRIVCSQCGRHFRRKTNSRKNCRPYYSWVCGERIDKKHGGCIAKSIPEWALYEMAAEIMGTGEFASDEFDKKVSSIEGGNDHEVVFHLRDGSDRTMTWKNRK